MLTKDLINAYHILEIPLFEHLSPKLFDALIRYLVPLKIKCGEILYHEEEFNTDVYFIVSGRIRIVQNNKKAKELGRGEICGEASLFSTKFSNATATATRDSFLLKLSKPAIEILNQQHPKEFFPLIQNILRILFESTDQENVSRFRDFFIYVDEHDAFAKELISSFKRELSKYGSTVIINKEETFKHGDNLDSWLVKQEMDNSYIIYEADKDDFRWTEKYIKQADRVLVFCLAKKEAGPNVENIYFQARKLGKAVDLVLIHPPETLHPTGTRKWLNKLPDIAWHHMKNNSTEDLQRIVRIISGNAITLVLGGGGARSLVYIGLYKALQELKIPVDWVGGSCSGSMVAGVIAWNPSIDEMIEVTKKYGPNGFRDAFDFTLPILSMMSGNKINHMLRSLFGHINIEDLWINYFSIATNLTKSQVEAIKTGPLWEAIRSSISIPLALPPTTNADGDILIDGAVMNNLPVDVMKNCIYRGKIIAGKLNTRPLAPITLEHDAFGFWQSFKRYLFGSHPKVNLAKILDRTTMLASRRHASEFSKHADFLISYDVTNVGYFQFHEVDRLVELGYQQAIKRAEELFELKKSNFVKTEQGQ